MKRIFLFIILFFSLIQYCFSQQTDKSGVRILFRGVVMDANTFSFISNSQILINRNFSSISNVDGTFAFFVNKHDSVLFKHLGYKSTLFFVNDTLAGKDFVAG